MNPDFNPQPSQQPPRNDQFTPPNQQNPYTPRMSGTGTPPPTPPRRKKGLLIAGAIAGVVVVAIVAVVLFGLFLQPNDTADTTETADQPAVPAVTADTLAALTVLEARDAVDAPITPADGFETFTDGQDQAPLFARPSQLSSNETYAVFPATAYGFSVAAPLAESQAIETALIDYMLSKNFNQAEQQTVSDQERFTRFDTPGAVCHVYRYDAEATAEIPATVSLGCANSVDFVKTLEDRAPFAAVYRAEEGVTPLFDSIVINPGSTEGSETAEATIRSYPFGGDGIVASFTRTSGGDWQLSQ